MNYISQRLSIKEKVGYSLGDLSANLVFQSLITFLAWYYTNIYGLNENDAAWIIFLVGVIAACLFNPIIGALADRTKSRWGKFRPWILWTAVPLGVISVLAFTTPDFSYSGKVIYAVVTYTLLLLLYAGSNLPSNNRRYERKKQHLLLPICCCNDCSIFCTGADVAPCNSCR